MCLHRVCLVNPERLKVLWNWNYTRLLATMWELGINPGSSSTGKLMLLTFDPSLQPKYPNLIRDLIAQMKELKFFKVQSKRIFSETLRRMTQACNLSYPEGEVKG